MAGVGVRMPGWDRSARGTAALVFIGGVALMVVPPVAGSLDALSGLGAAPVVEKTVVTTVTEESPGAAPRTTRTETVERAPLIDRGIVARAFEMPGATFFFRLALVLFAAVLAGGFVQSVGRARFRVQLGGIGLGGADPAIEDFIRALSAVRTDPALAPREAEVAADIAVATQPETAVGQGAREPVYRLARAPEGLRRTLTAARRATERRYEYVSDPHVAVLTLQGDLEQRLRVLAEQAGVGAKSLPAVVRALASSGRLSARTATGIEQIFAFARRVEDGARVPADVLDRVRSSAPEILDHLDGLIFGDLS